MNNHEQQIALEEAAEIAAEDEYFQARPQIDCAGRRKVFAAGFSRAWRSKQQAVPIDTTGLWGPLRVVIRDRFTRYAQCVGHDSALRLLQRYGADNLHSLSFKDIDSLLKALDEWETKTCQP